MWVLDDPKNIAEWIEDGRDANPLAYFLDSRSFLRAKFNQPPKRGFRIDHTPVRGHAAIAARR